MNDDKIEKQQRKERNTGERRKDRGTKVYVTNKGISVEFQTGTTLI
jgi:hypothetical protein